MDHETESVQTVVLLPVGVRKACERRAAAERRSLSGYLRNVIADSVGDEAGAPAVAAAGRGKMPPRAPRKRQREGKPLPLPVLPEVEGAEWGPCMKALF